MGDRNVTCGLGPCHDLLSFLLRARCVNHALRSILSHQQNQQDRGVHKSGVDGISRCGLSRCTERYTNGVLIP